MNFKVILKKLETLFRHLYGDNFYKKLYLLIFIIFLISGFEILGAYLLAPVFSLITSHNIKDIAFYSYVSSYINEYNIAIIYSLMMFFIINVMKNLFTIKYANLSTLLRLDVIQKLRTAIFKNILHKFYELDKVEVHNVGELNNIIIGETYKISTAVGSILAFFNAALVSVLLVMYLLYIDFSSTLIILLSISVIFYLNKYIVVKVGFYSKQAFIQWGKLSGIFNETIQNMKLVYTKNALDYEINKFDINNKLEVEITRKRDFLTNYTGPITEIMAVIILVFTIYIISSNNNNIGENIAYIYVIIRLMPYIKMINSYKVLLANSIGSIDTMLNYTKNSDKNYYINNDSHFNKIDNILIKNLSFSYNNNDLVLNNFNLQLKQGSIVEIVGESGSGKSTLFDILLKIRDSYEGNILINDKELKSISKYEWYSKIGYVSQEPLLFNESLAYNIAYPNDINEKQVVECLKQASLHDYISNIYYAVGENGSKLSGGQKQRVSIARALYNKPYIIFFDEATSALDKDTELNIVNTINNLPKDLIILLITHRELKINYTKKINLTRNNVNG